MIRKQAGTARKRQAAALVVAASLLTPLAALGWKQGADFETRIHGHEFARASLESDQCNVKVRVLFNATEDGYKSEAPARNFYRFHARIKLDDGRAVVSRMFSNSAPGWRAYTYTLDTGPDGCWAKQERKIVGIDVEGCRGAGCKPEPLQ